MTLWSLTNGNIWGLIKWVFVLFVVVKYSTKIIGRHWILKSSDILDKHLLIWKLLVYQKLLICSSCSFLYIRMNEQVWWAIVMSCSMSTIWWALNNEQVYSRYNISFWCILWTNYQVYALTILILSWTSIIMALTHKIEQVSPFFLKPIILLTPVLYKIRLTPLE